MSNKNSSIHDFDVSLICDYYSLLDRQGPGSPEITQQALGFIRGLNDDSRIADLGCGTGGQTRVLAQHAPGFITGIDIFPTFISLFNKNAENNHLEHRVKGLVGSMDKMPFGEEELDLIWSEGAIYNIGFEEGFRYWRKFLKPGGYVAVSEATWFTDERPAEINDFWEDAYPGIDTIPAKVKQMQEAGYFPVAAFALPEICWTEHFFKPQVESSKRFLEKHPGNRTAEEFVANQRHESALYMKYGQYYGYAFFIGRKI